MRSKSIADQIAIIKSNCESIDKRLGEIQIKHVWIDEYRELVFKTCILGEWPLRPSVPRRWIDEIEPAFRALWDNDGNAIPAIKKEISKYNGSCIVCFNLECSCKQG